MMTLVRRFLTLIAFSFWQGGFLFYVSVVVPMGTAVLRSAQHQGFITRRVTEWLNVSAVVVLTILALELLLCRETSRIRRWLSWGTWAFMVGCQIVLFHLHAHLSGMMIDRGRIVTDPEAFYLPHRVYLWTHTVQWAAGLIFVVLLLSAWRAEDRRPG